MKVNKFKVLLYLKKSSLDKQGKAPIMGRITLNNSMAQFSCKLSCNPKLWNSRSSRLEGKSGEATETNAKIERILLSVNAAFDNLVKRNVVFTATSVKEMMQGCINGQTTLLQVFDSMLEETKSRVGIDRKPATYRSIRQVKDSIANFVSSKYGTKDMAFGQMTNQFISDYEHFLFNEQRITATTAHKYFTYLKMACHKAYKEGVTDKHLFTQYREPTIHQKTPRTITPDDFQRIVNLQIPAEKESLIISRDLLLIACYTGMAYADAVSVTTENLYTDENGSLWLKYKRKKTGVQAMVKLLPEAIELISKYENAGQSTLMPQQNYDFLLKNLKAIAEMAGCTQHITHHMGRHYYASILTLANDVPIDVISKMLGHTNVRTTQVYAMVTQDKLFEEADKFIEATKDFVLVLDNQKHITNTNK
jgi:site-specific recombinase XerD